MQFQTPHQFSHMAQGIPYVRGAMPAPKMPVQSYTKREHCDVCSIIGLFSEELGLCFCDIRGSFDGMEGTEVDLTYLDVAMAAYGRTVMKSYLSSVRTGKLYELLEQDGVLKKVLSDPERPFFELYYELFQIQCNFLEHLNRNRRLSRRGIAILVSLEYNATPYFCSPDDFDLLREQDLNKDTLACVIENLTTEEIDKLSKEMLSAGREIPRNIGSYSPFLRALASNTFCWARFYSLVIHRISVILDEQVKRNQQKVEKEASKDKKRKRSSKRVLVAQVEADIKETGLLNGLQASMKTVLPSATPNSTTSMYPEYPLDQAPTIQLNSSLMSPMYESAPMIPMPSARTPSLFQKPLVSLTKCRDVVLTDEMKEVLRAHGYEGTHLSS